MHLEEFSERELDYYSRQIVLKDVGLSGQKKIKDSKVCVAGAGGLGSPILIQLASMGVGYIRVIDRDVVEISNLQRQHIYDVDVLGVPKVEAAKRRLGRLNPFIEIDAVPMPVTPGNSKKLIKGVNIVMDALDAMAPRYALNRACNELNIPFIHGGVIMQSGTVSTILPGKTACLECFQGSIRDEDLQSCAVLGVHPSVISMIASIQVSEAVKIILGQDPVLASKLLFADLSDLSVDKIQLSKLENCPVCGTGERKQIEFSAWEEVCGREGGRTLIYNPERDEQLDPDTILSNILKSGYEVVVSSEMGFTFKGKGIKGSMLLSGVSIFEGPLGLEEAKGVRQKLLS